MAQGCQLSPINEVELYSKCKRIPVWNLKKNINSIPISLADYYRQLLLIFLIQSGDKSCAYTFSSISFIIQVTFLGVSKSLR